MDRAWSSHKGSKSAILKPFLAETNQPFRVIIVAFLVEKVGNVPTASDGRQLVVNTRMELCGAFINKMNVTYVNYTVKGESKDEKKDR